jgi:hypothetical protein
VPNLSAAGRAWATRVGGVRSAFERLVQFINSSAVQEVWAPAFGRSRALPVPLDVDLGNATGLESRPATERVMHLELLGGAR